MLTELNHFLVSLYSRLQVHREEGQALVEYTLILALVSVVAVAALQALGTDIIGKLGEVATDITGA